MWKINAFRTLTTESLAVFIPFKVQEIQDKGGIYFGENAISHNLIMCSKANLLNQPAFLLGVPGGGKSFSAKGLIAFLKYYHFVRAEQEEDFDEFIAKCKKLALYDTGVSAEYGDRLIPLSTCEYSRTNGRMVVVAKLLNEYLRLGGFPIVERGSFDERSAYQIVEGIYNSVITNDITKRQIS